MRTPSFHPAAAQAAATVRAAATNAAAGTIRAARTVPAALNTVAAIIVLLAAPATAAVIDVAEPYGWAVQAAIDQTAPGDTVRIPPEMQGTIILVDQQILIPRDVTIVAVGESRALLQASASTRIFRVPAGVTATIENVAMLLGEALVGGGIANYGHLTLIGCLVSHCRAPDDGGAGGGIANVASVDAPATLRLIDTNVVDNAAEDAGGAIANLTYGTYPAVVEITGGGLARNHADRGGAMASYGQFGGVAMVRMEDAVILDNTAEFFAAGLSVETFAGGAHSSLELTDVRVERNTAEGFAGGLHTAQTRTSFILRGCTITGNHASYGSPDIRQIATASHVAFLGDNVVGDASDLLRWASTPSDQIGTMAAAPAAPATRTGSGPRPSLTSIQVPVTPERLRPGSQPASQADHQTDDLAGNEPHDQTD